MTRPTMSSLPSPLKLPTSTSTQLTLGFQPSHRLVVKPTTPSDRDTHHWPVCKSRPMRSLWPSPLKSPVCTSSQVTAGLQAVPRDVLKAAPVEWPIHHWPELLTLPAMLIIGI